MITHLEPDILECEEVKRPFGNITKNKVSGGDRIPAELFNIVKDDVVKVMQSICQQIWKLSSGHRTGKEINGKIYPIECGVPENNMER